MRVLALLALLMAVTSVSSHPLNGSHWIDAHDLPIPLSDSVAVQVNGVIYLGGGCVSIAQPTAGGNCPNVTNQQVTLDLNQASPVWTATAPMPRIRHRQAVAAVGNLIYHVGGRDPSDNIVVPIDVYNITSGTWSTLPTQTCNCLNISDPAAFAIGSKLYITGGYDQGYDYLNGTYVLDTSAPIANQQFLANVVPDLPWHAGDLGAVAINGLGYVMGGWGPDNGCIPLNGMAVYDPTSNKWTVKKSFVHPRGDFAVAAIGTHIYVSGGENKELGCVWNASAPNPWAGVTQAAPVGDVERYDIATDSWNDYGPIALQSFRFSGVSYRDVLFDIGGQGEEAVVNGIASYPLIPEVYYLNVTVYDAYLASLSKSHGHMVSVSSIMVTVLAIGVAYLF